MPPTAPVSSAAHEFFRAMTCSALATLLRAAARAEIMPRFRRLDAHHIRAKTGPLDLVTDADEAAEAMIDGRARQNRFPGCVVVGEEATSRDAAPARPACRDAELAFVVDPVDGTYNFAMGLPLFGCMAAAIVRGEVVAAAIHDPVGDDTALRAARWRRLDGGPGWQAPSRSACRRPGAGRRDGRLGVSWRFMSEPLRSRTCRNFVTRVRTTFDYRCAAHEYRLLADGGCDFLLFNKLMPWDHAPGWLLHQEAGGYAAQFDGTPYSPSRKSAAA